MSTVCRFKFSNGKHCRNRTTSDTGFCHKHSKHCLNVFLEEKPDSCAVCLGSLHQTRRPLECGHWIHRACVLKSEKDECPVCRAELPATTNLHAKNGLPTHRLTFEIPTELIASVASTAVVFSIVLDRSVLCIENKKRLPELVMDFARYVADQLEIPPEFDTEIAIAGIASQIKDALNNPHDY